MEDQSKSGPLSRAVTASLCILAALVAADLLREPQLPAERASSGQSGHRAKWQLFGQPPELAKFAELLSRAGGQQLTQLELSHRLLLYTDDLLSVGSHNLAALAGLETYLVQQLWPNSTGLEVGPSRAAAPASDGHLERLVRAPSLMKLFKSDTNSEITMTSGEIKMFNDHRKCFNTIRDQGSCGSCYAFSLIALVEWHYCGQFNELADFSEQFIIDCGRATRLDGCNEGQPSKAKDFCVHNGLKLERDWPYRGNDNRKQLVCSAEELRRNEIVMNSINWRVIEVERETFERTLEYQPILINLNSPKKFARYKKGVHSGQSCDTRQPHGAVLVGDGVADGEEFWLIRNSYGSDWGEGGYMRLSKGADMKKCFDDAMVSKFMFHSDEAAFENLYDTFKFYPSPKKIVPKSGLSRELLRL